MERIGLCIPTYRRPEYLDRLLEKFCNLTFLKSNDVEIFFFVIDNDEDKSAYIIFEKYITLVGNLFYFVENKKGYSNVRNKCISVSKQYKCNYMAFIDDDELPSDQWLDELLSCLKEFNAYATFGPVVPIYEKNTPKWIIKGGFFNKVGLKNGEVVPISRYRTSNALMKLNDLGEISFNKKFNELGGEDTSFFEELNKKKGCKYVWCEKAIVYETVPLLRSNLSFLLKRAYNNGKSSALRDITKFNSIYIALIIIILKVSFNIIKNLLVFLLTFFLGYHILVKFIMKIYREFGRLTYIIKFVFKMWGFYDYSKN